MIKLLLWLILFILCWPIALLALVLWPLVWLISLPFSLAGNCGERASSSCCGAIVFLPARLLGEAAFLARPSAPLPAARRLRASSASPAHRSKLRNIQAVFSCTCNR